MNTKYWRLLSLLLAIAIAFFLFVPVSSFSGLGGYHAEKNLGIGATPNANFLIGTSTSAFLVLDSIYPPEVTNGVGATNVDEDSAQLNGELTEDGNSTTTVTVFYGTADGGTTPASWSNNSSLGAQAVGTFSYNAGSLVDNTLYYYRMFAENSVGNDWANTSANFTTSIAPPTNLILTDMGAISVNATWNKSAGATYTMVRVKRSAAPANPTDGELLYYYTGTDFTTVGYALETTEYFFRAWSFASDNVTYSAGYAEASIGGENMETLAGNFFFMILAILALGLVIAMFATKQMMLGFPAGMFWFILGGYAYTQSISTWDINYFLFFGSMGMGIFSVLAMYGLRTKKEELAEGDEFIDEGKDDLKFIDEGGNGSEDAKASRPPYSRSQAIRDRARRRREAIQRKEFR